MDHRRAPAGRIFLLRQRSLAGVSALALSIAALSAIDAGSGSARASEMYLPRQASEHPALRRDHPSRDLGRLTLVA